MFAIDGNNSLKRLAAHGERYAADRRTFEESDYYLPNDYVDRFAAEVKSRKQSKPSVSERFGEAGDDVDAEVHLGKPGEGDPTDGGDMQDFLKTCVRNWKSAAAEETKRMWSIFDETGIFAGACRHGLILWLIDMIRSGEL